MGRFITKLMLLFTLFASNFAFAEPPVFLNGEGVALTGYDPVAYFTDNKPVQGQKAISFRYQDATYYFASEAHREAFQANPEKYLPQYGGYCAYGASFGHKAPGDPTQWSVVNGKLYINYNERVQQQWTAARDATIEKADKVWVDIKNK